MTRLHTSIEDFAALIMLYFEAQGPGYATTCGEVFDSLGPGVGTPDQREHFYQAVMLLAVKGAVDFHFPYETAEGPGYAELRRGYRFQGVLDALYEDQPCVRYARIERAVAAAIHEVQHSRTDKEWTNDLLFEVSDILCIVAQEVVSQDPAFEAASMRLQEFSQHVYEFTKRKRNNDQ